MAGDRPELTGGCGCGAVRWRLSEPPLGAAICHCTRCQRRTGTALSVSAWVKPGTLSFDSGEKLLGEWRPEGGWAKLFCARCGSHTHSSSPDGSMTSVRMGGFDSDPGVRPAFHQFVAYAAAWQEIPDDGLPRFDERAPATRPPATS